MIETFVDKLKLLNGQFSSVGQQRIIRLNAACSKQYVSLRQTRIKADIPTDEAYKDPYSKSYACFRLCLYQYKYYFCFLIALIEQQIYRRFSALKSFQTNKYVCFNPSSGNFHLKVNKKKLSQNNISFNYTCLFRILIQLIKIVYSSLKQFIINMNLH